MRDGSEVDAGVDEQLGSVVTRRLALRLEVIDGEQITVLSEHVTSTREACTTL
jgi:hypothetical protein